MAIGFNPVSMKRVSFDIVRYALASPLFVNICAISNFISQLSFSMVFFYIGAPNKRRGSIPPLYIVFGDVWISPAPQLNFSELESANINFVHYSGM